MVDRLDKAIVNHRIQNNKITTIGYLGDGSGVGDPRLSDGTGRYWVRVLIGGAFSAPVALPLDTNANVPPSDNIAVEIGYIRGEQVILKCYREGLLQSGVVPLITNPSDPQVQDGQNTADIKSFFCRRSSDSSKPFTVVVESGYIEVGGVSHFFAKDEIDLTGFLPSAGEKNIACVYLTASLTLEAFASTPTSVIDPILDTNIDECRQQADPTDMSIWGWVLEGDASALTEDITKNIDLRPKFTMPQSGSGSQVYPQRFSVMCDELLSYDSSNTPISLTHQYEGTQFYTIYVFQASTPHDGDYFTCSFLLATGTYTCYALGSSAANRGKIDWTLDGASQTTADDWYSGSTTQNVIHSFTLTALTDGYHILKGTINGTHGGSDYYFALTKIWCTPSAD